MHDRKSQISVIRNIAIKNSASEGSEENERCGKENLQCHRKYFSYSKQTVGRNIDTTETAYGGNEEFFIIQGEKQNSVLQYVDKKTSVCR